VLRDCVVDDTGEQAQAKHEQYLLAPADGLRASFRGSHATGRLRVRRWTRADLGVQRPIFILTYTIVDLQL